MAVGAPATRRCALGRRGTPRPSRSSSTPPQVRTNQAPRAQLEEKQGSGLDLLLLLSLVHACMGAVSYRELLTVLWDRHDPTTLNRQGNDVGTQYRSG